jgi:hypothetical protein
MIISITAAKIMNAKEVGCTGRAEDAIEKNAAEINIGRKAYR